MGKDGVLYRAKAVVKIPARKHKYSETEYEAETFEIEVGPYTTTGAAKGSLSQEIRNRTYHLDSWRCELAGEIEVERWIEKAHTTWARLAE